MKKISILDIVIFILTVLLCIRFKGVNAEVVLLWVSNSSLGIFLICTLIWLSVRERLKRYLMKKKNHRFITE